MVRLSRVGQSSTRVPRTLPRYRVSALSAVGILVAAGPLLIGCSGDGDASTTDDGVAQSSPEPGTLPEADRLVLNEMVGPGHGDKVAAAGSDADLCDALRAAVEESKALDAASGDALVALLVPSQEPMDRAATVLASKGFELTAAHFGRYRDALVETAADVDMSDQASRDRANLRFRIVKAKGAGTTETELGGLATVCGIA